MKGNIFSPEDKEFLEIVQSDLRRYLHKNIFPSRTVLVFPPFNGFRRFLIHKLIEDNFASSDVAAFSIGQDISRRIVVCYKGLISEAASKGLPATIPQPPRRNMIDKEKPNRQKQTPTAAVYRPPAARQAESRKSRDSPNPNPADTKQTRVRRPDQQMYVPRPKRASYGNDPPRSRSRSNSRLSLDTDQGLDTKKTTSVVSEEELRIPKDKSSKSCLESTLTVSSDVRSNDATSEFSISHELEQKQSPDKANSIFNCCSENVDSDCTTKTILENTKNLETGNEIFKYKSDKKSKVVENQIPTVEFLENAESKIIEDGKMQVDSHLNGDLVIRTETDTSLNFENTVLSPQSKKSVNNDEKSTDAMETISISSDSKSEDSRSSQSSSGSKSDSSCDRKDQIKSSKLRKSEKMDVDHIEEKTFKSRSTRKCHTKRGSTETKAQKSANETSEVLIISDSSLSDDSLKSANDKSVSDANLDKSSKQRPSKVKDTKDKCSANQKKVVNPDECDWESLYDDSGECLVPSLLEELTKSVGRVKVTSADSDYRPFQSVEERTNDGECVIEIYDFPAEFKTNDLFNVFAAYRGKNFQIKWVDDTHALGIFPSPVMADEVLACTLPFVKTRPLRLGIAESRTKARNLVLPPLPSLERPKTCSALARRLVTGALGLRIPTSSQEREKEKQVLKEAREKRRLEAKQREAAWEGTITSSSAI